MSKKQKVNKRQKASKKRKGKSVNLFNWSNIRIGYKYLISFLITITLFSVATVIVYSQLSIAKKDVKTIIKEGDFANDLAQIALSIERKDSYVSNFLLFNDERTIEPYRTVVEELDGLFDKVTSYYEGTDDAILFARIKDNNIDIDELFLNTIIDQSIDRNTRVSAQIQVDAKKSASVTLINRLIGDITEKQNETVAKTNKSLNKSNLFLAVANIVAILLGSLIMFMIGRSISRNLNRVVQMATELARGNLAIEPLNQKGRDEIGQLSQAVNAIRQNTRNILSEVTNASQSVTRRSNHLTQSATEVQLGSEQIAATMDELASAAETQATSASDLSENMQQFTESILASERDGQTIANDSKHVLSLTADGASLMRQSVSQMERIDTIVADAVEKVQGLDEQSDQISNLVSVVKDIADQTNLLSLNAAIEAARAGEHGQGFAVVANEVRKLAEEVTDSVTEITNIVNNIQSETDLVVSSLHEGYKEVEAGIDQIERTGENFTEIDSSITEMAERISAIALRLNNVAENSDEMNKLIEDIAAASEQAAAGVQQSSASTQESTSAMDEVARNANELEELAELLNKEIARFKLS